MKHILLSTVLVSAAAVTPAMAAEITIKDFVGTITIVEGDTAFDIIKAGDKPADVTKTSDTITINGNTTREERGESCKGSGMSWDFDFNGRESKGNTRLDDYPNIQLSVPAGTDLIIRDTYVALEAEVKLAAADLELSGCFDVKIENVEILDVEKSGSGDISVGRSGQTQIEKSGSGDVEIITTGDFSLEQSGAGDIDIEDVSGNVEIEKSGSGDIEIETLTGNLKVEKSGSGDIEIDSGMVAKLSIHNSGSGDVDVNAAVGDADVRASGSGDIYVKSISGSVVEEISGSADFSRGDD